jgi:hypothetical protein
LNAFAMPTKPPNQVIDENNVIFFHVDQIVVNVVEETGVEEAGVGLVAAEAGSK